VSEKKETVGRTLLVAFVLCIVCSTVVATAAVMLKPQQQAAQERDRAINILQIAHIYDPNQPLLQQMEQVEARVVDFNTGLFSDEMTPDQVIDARKVASTPELSTDLPPAEDLAKIGRRENYGVVYLVERDGELDRVVLPIRGYGLWSTLWGYMALEADLNTVIGLGYYQHAETPGLGGEVDNPSWRAQWSGKQVYDDGEVALRVVKGQAAANSAHQIDGLSGATLTTRGVDNMVQFWLGPQGWGKFLKNLKAGEA
jgi:Na+-transporting NADH:ubiquinone oxidoreductase subunit C